MTLQRDGTYTPGVSPVSPSKTPSEAILSAPTLDEQIRMHLETLEAAPGDVQAFEALAGLYESASRWEDLVALCEGQARLVQGVPLLARAAGLAHSKLRNVARAEALQRQVTTASAQPNSKA